MTAPRRIQRSRAKGWRMPAGAVYVGRGTMWGNWYRIAPPERSADVVCSLFKQQVDTGRILGEPPWWVNQKWCHADESALTYGDWLQPLRGRDLACWCSLSAPCHADVLLEIANAPLRCEGVEP